MPSATERSRSPIHHHRSKSPIRERRRSPNPPKEREKERSPRHRSSHSIRSPRKEINDRHRRPPEDEDSGRSRHRSEEHERHRSREQERHRSREHEIKESHRSKEHETKENRSREHETKESHRSREHETKESHRSREHETKESHRSREHETKESHRSREHETKESHRSREHETKESHRSREPVKGRHREEKAVEVENSIGRSERRPERDGKEGSSRSKRKRSVSPIDHERNVRTNSDDSPRRDSRSRGRDEVTSPRGEEHRDADDSVAKMKAAEEALEAKKKEEPSYELSGKLAAETNRVKGVTLLFTEPSDARKSDIRWRLYVFKGGEMQQEPLYIHRQTCYLFGRERRVADVPTDHPSCSKQHAVIQFRQVEKEQPDGMLKKQIGPYLMDLGSTNGTFLNETRIEAQRYYELFEKDTIKFGNSSREYVMLHENSAE